MKTRYISIPEAYDLLSKKTDYTETEGENLSYVEHLMKMKGSEAKKVKSELMKKFKLSEKVATKLVDIAPKTKEEFTSILSSYSVLLSEEELNNLIALFSED
jgi:DNA-directed RNA polymerase subunit F